ncbi:MAG: MmgE/PrpD family protein [Rhodospirillales bacterium]|jgi:2-methylcitrate dehydratase PrpD
MAPDGKAAENVTELKQDQSLEITKGIAEFAANLKFSDLPGEVVEGAKKSFMDTLGIGLAGSVEEAPNIVAGFVKDQGAKEVATVYGMSFKTSMPYAAWVNGISSDILGFSDICVEYVNHPSVTIVPALAALAEEKKPNGKDLITAHVLGDEVADNICNSLGPEFHLAGWHPLAVVNTLGGAIACGKVLGFDADQMANALGVASAEAAGMRGNDGSYSKAYGAGRSARDALYAALMTDRGYTGSKRILDVRDGFLCTFGAGVDGHQILETLGKPFDFIKPGMTYKAFPTCTRSHPGIFAAIQLKEKHGIDADAIEHVHCAVSPAVDRVLRFGIPENKWEGKYSLPYSVALALSKGKVVIKDVTDENARDPELRSLMAKIKMEVSPELAKHGFLPPHAPHGCHMTITMKDGTEYAFEQNRGPWEPATSPSFDDLAEKFRSCAELVLKDDQIEQAVEFCRDLENQDNIDPLMKMISG